MSDDELEVNDVTAPEGLPNAVLVLRSFGEDGTINVDVQTLGDVKSTEILTVLGIARKLVSGSLGVE